jgi:hypothetical protein
MEGINTYVEGIKTYKAILLSVLGLVIVVTGSYFYMKHERASKEAVVANHMHALTGQVTRIYEGENKLVYSMNIPETATSMLSMDDALVTINDNGGLYAAVYMTYEGGRGYSAVDYINNVVAPKVHALTVTGTTTVGPVLWTTAESANSEWHVGQVGDGQWLMVVESKKALHDSVMEMIESLTTK